MANKDIINLVRELNKELNYVVKGVKGAKLRELLELETHEYDVDLENITKQLKQEFSTKFSAAVSSSSFSPRLNGFMRRKTVADAIKKYVEGIHKKAKTMRPRVASLDVSGTETSFTVIATPTSDKNKSSIFALINRIRSEPLTTLRKSLEKELVVAFPELSENQVKDTIYGTERSKQVLNPNTNKIETKVYRSGGSLQLGHLSGYAIAERRLFKWGAEDKLGKFASVKTKDKNLSALIKVAVAISTAKSSTKLKTIELKADVSRLGDEGSSSNAAKGATYEAQLTDAIRLPLNEAMKTLAKIRRNPQDWAEFETSPSANAVVLSILLDAATKAGGKTNNKSRKISPSSSKVDTDLQLNLKSNKTTKRIKEESVGSINTQQLSRKKSDSSQQNKPNWLQLLPLINAKLTPQVIKNMGSPRLNNRTGRLAQSAQVVGVEQTPQGFPSFVFDYERDPYDVFDRTLGRSPWNTPERDPRTLVDQSVREIVREMAIGRFFTRRA